MGLCVLICAEIVGASEILSLFDAIGPRGYAIVAVLASIAASAAWSAAGRHDSSRTRDDFWACHPRRSEEPLLALLAFVVALCVGYELFVIVASPPNNYDSRACRSSSQLS